MSVRSPSLPFRLQWLLLIATVSTACTTIQIPLPGTVIMRPRAGLADAGARVTVGAGTTPAVEGTLAEIKDEQGNVINPLPGTKDTDGYEIDDTGGLLAVELGVDWSKRYEVGLSTSRGLFFMWDYALWDHAALTLTPSYSTTNSEGGDPKFKTKTDGDGNETTELEHGYKGRAENFNLTQLASFSVGNLKWAALYLYGGLGLNAFNASIKGASNDVEEKISQVAPSGLVGLHARLAIFELTVEAGGTSIKYRDGTSKIVPTSGAALSLHIAI